MTTRFGKSGRVIEVTLTRNRTPDEYGQYFLSALVDIISKEEMFRRASSGFNNGSGFYRNWISNPMVVDPLARIMLKRNQSLGGFTFEYNTRTHIIGMQFRPFEFAELESRVSRMISDEVELSILRMVKKEFPEAKGVEEYGIGPARKKELMHRGITYTPTNTKYGLDMALGQLMQKVARKRVVGREKQYVHRIAKWTLSTRTSLAVRKGWRAFRSGLKRGARR